MTSFEDAFVHARFADGETLIVGRYQFARSDIGRPHGEFRYVGSWYRNDHGRAFALDPVNLPLSDELFVTTKRTGLFGPLADTTPDAWGRRLVKLERPTAILSPVDWLLATDDDRVGCLAFSPTPVLPSSRAAHLGAALLADIAEAFEKIERGEPANPLSEQIYRAGRSLGGVRPKAVVDVDSQLWIAKFQMRDDAFDHCGAEHAAMAMAKLCGIDAAPTRLVDVGRRRAVLVKRFDRTEGTDVRPTVHFLSALSLLDQDDTSDRGSYADIAAELRRHGVREREDRVELFRRMAFNVLCGNRDDHLKNHALIHDDAGWRLSPAFDVLPQPDFYPMQAIAVGRLGSIPTIENCLSRCGDFGLGTDDSFGVLINSMTEVMQQWRTIFRELGVSETTIAQLGRAFAAIDSHESDGP